MEQSEIIWQTGQRLKLYLFYLASLSVPIVAGATIPLLSNSGTAHVLALSGRTIVLLADCMLFYLLTAQSVHLRRNAFGRYLRTFCSLYGMATFAMLADVIAGMTGIVRVNAGRTPEQLMQSNAFLFVTGMSQVAYAAFCAAAIATTAQVLQPEHWTLDQAHRLPAAS